MPTSYRFTGQREDTTGLYFYNARYYDPVVGRFAQADTIVPQPGNPQSFNRYSYTLNNPVKYRDPSGHVVETAWDIANVAWDIHEFANDRSVGNFVALALDTGAVLLPFVPAGVGILLRGGKTAAKMATHADEAADIAKIVVKGTEEAGRRGLLSFTKANFRDNLMRATGKTKDAAKGLEAHHMLPQELVDAFTSVGMKIHDPAFGAWVKGGSEHQKWSKWYNDDWKAWFENLKGRTPDADEVLAEAQRLAQQYGIDWRIPGGE